MGYRYVDMAVIQRRMRGKDERYNSDLKRRREEAALTDRLALAQTAPPAASTVTADELEIIKGTIAPNATAAELKLFFYDCQRRGVHPLDRKIHFTKRGNKYSPITSIDFLRERAVDSGEYAGNDDPVFAGTPKSASFTASVTVYRIVQGARYPFTATARWSEYLPDQAFMWNKMPHTMLGKCAEALALRKAFPKQLTGLYVREEMEQAEPAKIPPALTPDRSRDRVPQQEPAAPSGGEAAAAPADLNQAIPEAWVPFVKTEAITATIVAGKRSKTSGKTTLVLDSGEECWTLDHDLAKAASAYKEARTPITITKMASGEIVTLSEAVDAAF